MNYGFVIDNRKCIGCHACTVACKSEHDVAIGVNRTHVKYIEKGVFPHTRRTFTVIRCNHCENAPCTEICPTNALFTRANGIVDFDSERCIGCRSCMQACPYDALYIDPNSRTAAKCNYCAHRIENRMEPACVVICPVEAIISGDLGDPESKISRLTGRQQVTVRKPLKGTIPNVYYINGDAAALSPQLNSPLNSYMTTAQVKGVGHFAEHGEDWIARAAEEDLVPPTASTDWGGIEFLKSLGGVNLAGGVSVSRKSVDQVIEETESDSDGRRVYDAPAKGVLWGWQVPAYIWTKAVATGAVACSILSRHVSDQLTSMEQALCWLLALVFLALTAGLLVWDLDRPDRFLYVLFRPNWRSWLVRGAYILTSLAGMVTLLLFTLWLGWWPLLRIFEIPALILAILGAVYTSFLFGQAAGRDLWQSPLSPIRMLNQAFLAGSAVLIIIAPHSFGAWVQLIGTSLALNLLVLVFEVISSHSSEESAQAVRLMSTGRYGVYFWFGIAAGTVVPLILCFFGPASAVGVSAAALILAGIYLTEFVWVRVPQLIALS